MKKKVNLLTSFAAKIFYLFWLVAAFVYFWIKANAETAFRVLYPVTRFKPGFVKIKTKLKSEAALAVLANSLTLASGGIVLDAKDGALYVHGMDSGSEEAKKVLEAVKEKLERPIERIFE